MKERLSSKETPIRITATAPTRISLFGGGTDVDPFMSEHGGEVINMAIDLNQTCQLTNQPGRKEIHELANNIGQRYEVEDYSLTTDPEKGSLMGLGSSAAYCVATLGAFDALTGTTRTKEQMAERAWNVETDLGWITGKQDQYASACGGFNYWKFGDTVTSEPLPEGDLLKWMWLVNIGGRRHSGDVQATLRERMTSKQAEQALLKTTVLTRRARTAIQVGDYETLGKYLDYAWELKKEANPDCTNSRIDYMHDLGQMAGAWGGKILGSGQAGHMLFISPPETRPQMRYTFRSKLRKFNINYKGLEVGVG